MEKELELYDRKEIENRIFSIRSIQVMIDRELAEMYSVETKVLNQAVKRNIERFPISFRFQLTLDERDELVTNCDRLEILKHNDQYEPIKLKIFSKAHDRFLIIDGNIIYHIGASLKDLGKKWFAFSMIEKDAIAILERVSKVRN